MSTVPVTYVLSTHVAGLGVIRALGMMGIPVVAVYYEDKDMGYVSRYVIRRVRAPHPERMEQDFIELLVELSRTYKTGLLIPADDPTVVAVSRNKGLLDRYFTVACADWSVTRKFIEKKLTYAAAERLGAPVPKTIILAANGTLESAAAMELPCLLKPSQSHRYFEAFGRKMVRVETRAELASLWESAKTAGLEVLLQDIVPGDDTHGVNYNSYFVEGRPAVEFTAEKVRLGPPGFGFPRVVVSKEIPEVIDLGRQVLRGMCYEGYSCMEFKRDPRDGRYKFMEVNARLNRSSLLSVKCGVNFAWIMYRHLIQGIPPEQRPYRSGVYWIDMTQDVAKSLECHREEGYTAHEYLRPYLSPHVFAILDHRDSRPFLKRCRDGVSMAGHYLDARMRLNGRTSTSEDNNRSGAAGSKPAAARIARRGRTVAASTDDENVPNNHEPDRFRYSHDNLERRGYDLAASRRKKIWIDLDNSPHVPFFKPIIEDLRGRGYEVVLTARDCFQVCELAELLGLRYARIGRHYGRKKMWKVFGLFYRALQLAKVVRSEKPDLALSHGSRSQILLASMIGLPPVVIADYEYSKWLPIRNGLTVIVPEVVYKSVQRESGRRILQYPGIKEDVYVPSFKPDPDILSKLGIDGGELIVTVRPPATEAHYYVAESDVLYEAAMEFLGRHENIKVILLPRSERQADFARRKWRHWFEAGRILIPDAVVDGLNLIWHSDLVISGGGTMNREAAALGVPVYSIFRGRIGAVDRYLAALSRLVLLQNVEDIHKRILLQRWHRPPLPGRLNGGVRRRIVDQIVEIVHSLPSNGWSPAGNYCEADRFLRC